MLRGKENQSSWDISPRRLRKAHEYPRFDLFFAAAVITSSEIGKVFPQCWKKCSMLLLWPLLQLATISMYFSHLHHALDPQLRVQFLKKPSQNTKYLSRPVPAGPNAKTLVWILYWTGQLLIEGRCKYGMKEWRTIQNYATSIKLKNTYFTLAIAPLVNLLQSRQTTHSCSRMSGRPAIWRQLSFSGVAAHMW